jgi:hypothetical protein
MAGTSKAKAAKLTRAEKKKVAEKEAAKEAKKKETELKKAATRRRNREELQRSQMEAAEKASSEEEEKEDQSVMMGQMALLQSQVDALSKAAGTKRSKGKKRRVIPVESESSSDEADEDSESSSDEDDEVVVARPTKSGSRKRTTVAVQGHLFNVTGRPTSTVQEEEEEDDMSQSILLTKKEKKTVARRGYVDFFKMYTRIQQNQLTAMMGCPTVMTAQQMPLPIWLRLWATFAAEHIINFPHDAIAMYKYLDFIVQLQLEGADWRAYDANCRAHRGERASIGKQAKKWSEVNQTLYWKIMRQSIQQPTPAVAQQAYRAVAKQVTQASVPVTQASVPLPVQPVQKKKFYSVNNEEMKFGICWGFHYQGGCKEGLSCSWPDTHFCQICGQGHPTNCCPVHIQPSQAQFVPQTKPAPAQTVTSSATYQETPTQLALPMTAQLAPRTAQLALPDKPFTTEGPGRTSERKSSTAGRSSHK